jgi:hypothetical protein
MHVPEYDGYACLYARDPKDILNLFKDEEYLEKIFRKEANFVDISSLAVTFGYEEIYVEDGECINITDDGKSAFIESAVIPVIRNNSE